MNEKVMLFFGEDTFYIKNKVNQTIRHYNADDFNITTYDLDDTLITEALNDAWTIPFMSEKKVVVCQNAHFLSSTKPKKMLNHDTGYLKEYLLKPADETLLIITVPQARLDERLAITKQLKKHAKIVECKLKSGQDLVAWARRQVGNTGMTIDQDALNEFMKRVSHSTEFAFLEMKKLLLYAENERNINLAMIERVITKNIEDNVYEITNAILARNHREALRIYKDLTLYSEDPLRILGIIIRKYREMLETKIVLKTNKDPNAVQDHFNVSSGRAYYMMQNAKSVRQDKIEEHLLHLEKLDHHIKTGRVDKKMALELFILST